MKTVSRFEANLLRILHCLLRRVPLEQVLPLVTGNLPAPPCLSRAAVELVQDALAKGCVLLLARRGGWRPERFLRRGQAVEGRLWQRTPPAELGLHYSGETLSFLVWLATAKKDKKAGWQAVGDLTAGDQWVLFLAYEVFRGTAVGPLLQTPPFARHGLCRLAFPEDHGKGRQARPDFAPWTKGVGACILEVLQADLATRWRAAERRKARLGEWQAMQALGQNQEQVLTAFLDTVDAAGRWDLARFLLQAAAELLTEDATPARWVGGLTNAGPRLADRSATYKAALAFVRQTDRLRQWARRAQSVGYFDEEYQASQLWKEAWERWNGDALHARAQALVRGLDPLTLQT